MRILTAFVLLAPSGIAHADQCAWISRAVAERAAEKIHRGSSVVEWCEPCGESRPAEAQVVREMRAAPTEDPQYWQVLLNGKPIDLAYVFLQTSDDTYVNLASLVSCPASGVSHELHLKSPAKAHLTPRPRAP